MRLAVVLLACLLTGATAFADPPSLGEALQRIGSAEPAARLEAVARLALCRRPADRAHAARALERALFDAEPGVRAAAAAALVRLDARASGGEVVRLLGIERDVRVLPWALLALGGLHVEGAQPVLVRFASHPDPRVRGAALDSAGELGGADMRRLLLNSLQLAGEEDVDWTVRAAAILGLARAGRAEDLQAVQRAYEQGDGHGHWLARSAVARAVAALHPRPRAVLEEWMADEDPRVAVTAARGLADAGLQEVLLGHLADARATVRAAAVGGVRQAGLRQAAPRLRAMARGDRSLGVRWAATEVLFAWRIPAADELVLDALRSKEAAVWTKALALLAERTGERHGRDVEAWRAALGRARER